jgi:hypothetical protein
VTSAGLMKVLTDKATDIDLYGRSWQPAYKDENTKFYPRINVLKIYYLGFTDGKLSTTKDLPPVDLRDHVS